MSLSGMVPARFLTMTAHMVILIIIFWSRDPNVRANFGAYTPEQYTQKDTELIIGLSIALALFLVEFGGFFGGVSMFMPTQSLLSIGAHFSASVSLTLFVFEVWPSDQFWLLFGFCNALPAVFELILIIGVLAFKKGL
ncbi:transmembrane protein 107-like [Tubulanus polymorphus]|uniref:transmembrane protein 107-like n=1 Tax=Tubulanus polymorphus TaxID=672921 RepID=UPI003DA1CDCC